MTCPSSDVAAFIFRAPVCYRKELLDVFAHISLVRQISSNLFIDPRIYVCIICCFTQSRRYKICRLKNRYIFGGNNLTNASIYWQTNVKEREGEDRETKSSSGFERWEWIKVKVISFDEQPAIKTLPITLNGSV